MRYNLGVTPVDEATETKVTDSGEEEECEEEEEEGEEGEEKEGAVESSPAAGVSETGSCRTPNQISGLAIELLGNFVSYCSIL